MHNHLINMFNNIQNGQITKRSFIIQPRQKNCEVFLKILWKEGFISGYEIFKKNPLKLKIFLKYKNSRSVINTIKILSKPGRRLFYHANDFRKIKSFNNSLPLIFTSKGIKSITQCKRYGIGGELFILIN